MNGERELGLALKRSDEYGDVVSLVRHLGSQALEEFIDGIAPHLHAIQQGQSSAAIGLAEYLHDCALSAALIADAGGFAAMRGPAEEALTAPPMTKEEALAKFRQISG